MSQAIGMIETKGLIGSIEAADAMVKAANVELDKTRNGGWRNRNGYRSRRCRRCSGSCRCRS